MIAMMKVLIQITINDDSDDGDDESVDTNNN